MTIKTFALTLAGSLLLLLGIGMALAEDSPADGSLIWHTYMGGAEQANGTNHDWAMGVAMDESGYVYIVGHSVAAWNTDWDGDGTQDNVAVNPHNPLVAHAHQEVNRDVFVAKFSSDGELVWHTFMGTPVQWWGSYPGWTGQDDGLGIAVDSAHGAVYVTGMTTNHWTSPTLALKERYAFLARIDAGTGVKEWHELFGGGNIDVGRAVIVDGNGDVLVAGQSWSPWGAPLRSHYGGYGGDAFVAKFGDDGTLLWNTFLGSTNGDVSKGLALDESDSIYVAGTSSLYYTDGTWGGTTSGQLKSPAPDACPAEPYLCGSDEAFAARLGSNGHLDWYGFYGGTWRDWANGIDVDQSFVYLVGDSDAAWGDTSTWTDLSDAFVAKIGRDDGVLAWNTFLGGHMADTGHAITVDSVGRIFVTGADFGSYWGGQDLFVAALDDAGDPLWAPALTLLFDQPDALGWGGHEDGFGIALDEDGALFVVGYGQYERGSPLRHHSDVITGLLTGDDLLLARIHAGAAESDADGDGVPDEQDICPGHDDNVDTDQDGVPDGCDNCPNDAQNDADGDGVCGDIDVCPGADDTIDIDNDGLPDFCDVCPADFFNDADGDGYCAGDDNCPEIANSTQADNDFDGAGDECDSDDDNDGYPDDQDNCPLVSNDQSDFDGDGAGDECDADVDSDGIRDDQDACPLTPVEAPVDADGCAIAQLCPCGNEWKNHGAFVNCVAHASEDFLAAGHITETEKDAIVASAAESSCGHKE